MKLREKLNLTKKGLKSLIKSLCPWVMTLSNVINNQTLPFAVSNEFPAKQEVVVLGNRLANINSNCVTIVNNRLRHNFA